MTKCQEETERDQRGKVLAQGAGSVLAARGSERAHRLELAKGKDEVAAGAAKRVDVEINRKRRNYNAKRRWNWSYGNGTYDRTRSWILRGV
ncbi:MAG: hypothetical protein A2X48_02495 [Lentisphaerae bacterium GWF2_49_21]|nr:MAG: hypothetical protein A2X48_02495 [Lentisphaerae bacterium GWF2_49_21]